MNLCKYGIHDYETVSDKSLIKDKMNAHLVSKGFEFKFQKKGSDIWVHEDGTVIYDFGFFDDHTLMSCYPSESSSKVCLKCGKVKLNYSMEKCLKNIDYCISELRKANEREKLAKKIRGEYGN